VEPFGKQAFNPKESCGLRNTCFLSCIRPLPPPGLCTLAHCKHHAPERIPCWIVSIGQLEILPGDRHLPQDFFEGLCYRCRSPGQSKTSRPRESLGHTALGLHHKYYSFCLCLCLSFSVSSLFSFLAFSMLAVKCRAQTEKTEVCTVVAVLWASS
jgi:hypothetical protein